MEVVLECTHSFCERCIHNWRKKHNTCPLCRDEKHSSPFFLVEEAGMQETIKLREELLEKVRKLIG